MQRIHAVMLHQGAPALGEGVLRTEQGVAALRAVSAAHRADGLAAGDLAHPPAEGPARPEGGASWARDLGLPRRVFALSPGELKPIYIDFDSPVLTRILCRQLRRRLPRPAGAVHRDAPRA